MPIKIDDLLRVRFLSWENLRFFLFHRSENKSKKVLRTTAYQKAEERVKELFRQAYDAEELKPLKTDSSAKSIPFEKLRFKRKDVMQWLQDNLILELLFQEGVCVEKNKLTDLKKLLRTAGKETLKCLSDWKQVKFSINREGIMESSAGGTALDAEWMGKNIRGVMRILLWHIVRHGKPFELKDIPKEVLKNKIYIPRLNKVLQQAFRVNSSPIPYNRKAGQYVPQFHCESKFKQ
jgi:hypothetical protein